MIKIEALSLEDAFKDAAQQLGCSITEINIEVVQAPSNGFMGMFKKKAIIVAAKKVLETPPVEEKKVAIVEDEVLQEPEVESKVEEVSSSETLVQESLESMQTSFVSEQDDEEDILIGDGLEYTADYDDAYDENFEEDTSLYEIETIVSDVKNSIEKLFDTICFDIDTIEVSVYDKETLLIEFQGQDAALLIGKEGYRYKALSYMLFNWINAEYNVGVILEIAEFLKNQEESVNRYLESVYESVDRDGRAQTKILDGVLIQIALKELRERYPDKYVVIRSTKDGLKYIIINDYHN
jgi:spoIIIJ-associated protein